MNELDMLKMLVVEQLLKVKQLELLKDKQDVLIQERDKEINRLTLALSGALDNSERKDELLKQATSHTKQVSDLYDKLKEENKTLTYNHNSLKNENKKLKEELEHIARQPQA